MEQDEVKGIVVKISSMTDRFEERGDQVVQSTRQATQLLNQAAQNVLSTSERMSVKALSDFKKAAGDVLTEGMREPIKNYENTLQSSVHKIESATQKLESRLQLMQQAHTAYAWKVFVACAVASLAVVGVAVYAGVKAHQEIKRADWISSINAAIANGKLAVCGEGEGICAVVDKKSVRLDQ